MKEEEGGKKTKVKKKKVNKILKEEKIYELTIQSGKKCIYKFVHLRKKKGVGVGLTASYDPLTLERKNG